MYHGDADAVRTQLTGGLSEKQTTERSASPDELDDDDVVMKTRLEGEEYTQMKTSSATDDDGRFANNDAAPSNIQRTFTGTHDDLFDQFDLMTELPSRRATHAPSYDGGIGPLGNVFAEM